METTRSPYIKHLYVCTNQREEGKACCAQKDSEALRQRLKAYVKANGLQGKVRVSSSGCMDLCAKGGNVMVYPQARWYHGVGPSDADRIIQEQLEPLTHNGKGAAPIKAFLFDLGNVLVRFDHMKAAQKITANTPAKPEALFQLFFDSTLVTDHDEGRISTKHFYEAVKEAIDLKLPYDQFLEVWNHIFTLDSKMTELVLNLLKQYPCYLISNTNRPHFEYLRDFCPVLKELNGWILSYEIGALKPHPTIYHRALELAQLPPREIFYIDDRPDLIHAGDRLGFQTHRFTDYEALSTVLTEQGVLHGK
jgi:glucose-1-phosphatase